jgi:hypothetical protein
MRKLEFIGMVQTGRCRFAHEMVIPGRDSRLVEMVITPDGHLLGLCEGEASFRAFLGAADDLLRNIHGVAPVAGLDGDEIGFPVAKVAEIKRQW